MQICCHFGHFSSTYDADLFIILCISTVCCRSALYIVQISFKKALFNVISRYRMISFDMNPTVSSSADCIIKFNC